MKKLLLILLLVFPLHVHGAVYAVLVGVSEYAITENNLIYSHRDAMGMYELLKKHTTPDKIKLLINRQAKHDNIVYYTKQLFLKAKPEDVVIFYFS